MKTIGLIGGMGWESSKLYYERINKLTNKILGGSHSAKIILVSVDFAEIEKLTNRGDWNAIGKIVINSAKQLEQAGADMILLCTNLIHIVSRAITKKISIPLLHIADATGEAIQKQKIKRILLLGTKDTMEKDFYTNVLENCYNLQVVTPNIKDRALIHNIIYKELLKREFSSTSKNTILKIIKEGQSLGVEGVILGCTELTFLITDADVNIPTFDTGYIHVNKAISVALQGDIEKIKKKNSFKENKIILFFTQCMDVMSRWMFYNPKTKSTNCSNKSDIIRIIHKQ